MSSWPVLHQPRGDDRLGSGVAAQSTRSAGLRPRTEEADRVVPSICPYCAVGCGQRVFVKDERVVQATRDSGSATPSRVCVRG